MATKTGNTTGAAKSHAEARGASIGNGRESVQGYFRAIFKENPKLLKERSNDDLYERWLKDHPGEKEVPVKIKQNLSNIKSVLRGKLALRKWQKQVERAEAANGAVTSVRPMSPALALKGLDQLESRIDDALALAKNLDREGLEEVIKVLRAARNRVIIRIGEQ